MPVATVMSAVAGGCAFVRFTVNVSFASSSRSPAMGIVMFWLIGPAARKFAVPDDAVKSAPDVAVPEAVAQSTEIVLGVPV